MEKILAYMTHTLLSILFVFDRDSDALIFPISNSISNSNSIYSDRLYSSNIIKF